MAKLFLLLSSVALLSACATPPAPETPKTADTGCGQAKVISDTLSLRAAPALNAHVLALLAGGSEMAVLECTPTEADGVPWIKVKTLIHGQETTGWISSKPRYLQMQGGKP